MADNHKRIEYLRTHTLTGSIEVLTGLCIGAGRDTVEIGGLDSPVIKHPHTGEPYIPGSSIKGKVRSLLEWALGRIEPDGSVWGSGKSERYEATDPILRIFGTTLEGWQGGPTRVLIRDAPLNEAWRKQIVESGLPLTEEKQEVVIDRIQGKAAQAGPRTMERVPAGAKFDLEIQFRIYAVDGDGGATDRKCLNWLIAGLKLLEADALGGSGSRGYGKVRFSALKLDGVDIQEAFDNMPTLRSNSEPPYDFLALIAKEH